MKTNAYDTRTVGTGNQTDQMETKSNSIHLIVETEKT